jgi:O-antigen/teichoic acid export membrane protein
MLFSILGAAITIGLNILFIPLFGYVGSAWATLICYLTMCLISYAAGQKNYPIPYQPFKVLFYIVTALLIFWTHQFIPKYSLAGEFFAGIAGLIIFSVLFIRSEKDLKNALLKWISLKR